MKNIKLSKDKYINTEPCIYLMKQNQNEIKDLTRGFKKN